MVLRSPMHLLLLCLAVVSIMGCSKPQEAETEKMPVKVALSFEEALQTVQEQLPAAHYISNDFLPANDALTLEPWTGALTPLRVGLNWIKNDEVVPLYVGIERGYFAQAGFDLEVVPGGPGRRPLPLLATGKLDIYMEAAGSQVIWARKSKTPVPLKIVGAILQEYPYSFITLDQDTPPDQRSNKVLTRDDFIGKKIGLSPAAPNYIRRFAFEQLKISEEDVNIVSAGATLEPLISGVYDFYGSWMDNDPRILDKLGYKNWVYWSFPEHGWLDLATLVTVMPQTLEEHPDRVRRFLVALTLATLDMMENPEAAAEAALKHIDETGLTKSLILKRIAYQSNTIRPKSSDKPVLYIEAEKLNAVAARMYQYGSIHFDTDE